MSNAFGYSVDRSPEGADADMTNLAVMDARLTRVENDVKEMKSDIKELRAEMKAGFKEMRAEMQAGFKELRDMLAKQGDTLAKQGADIAYVKGRLEMSPTTLQLGGFVIAIFVAAGLTRYFVH